MPVPAVPRVITRSVPITYPVCIIGAIADCYRDVTRSRITGVIARAVAIVIIRAAVIPCVVIPVSRITGGVIVRPVVT
jgi:hypothetical protein